MSEALQEIKTSLGPEALLLSTKEIPRRSGVWGKSSGFEVVAASDHSEDIDVFSPSGKRELESARTAFSGTGSAASACKDEFSEVYSPVTLAKNASSSSSKKLRRPKRKDLGANSETSDEISTGKGKAL